MASYPSNVVRYKYHYLSMIEYYLMLNTIVLWNLNKNNAMRKAAERKLTKMLQNIYY